jgi:hypothetical protein
MPLFSKQTVPIYGVIGFLQFSVEVDDDEKGEDLLYGYARETHRELESEIGQQVEQTLGSDFEMLEVRLNRGSVSILIILGATGTFYMGFSRYESFIKSVNLLVSQLKSVLRKFFERINPGPPDIDFSYRELAADWNGAQCAREARSIFRFQS